MQTLSSTALSRIISLAYRRSFEDCDFSTVFDEIQANLGCRFVFAAEWDGCRSAYSNMWIFGDLDARGLRAYDDYKAEIYRHDPMIAQIESNRLGCFSTSVSVIGEERYLDNQYVRWSGEELGSTYWTLFYDRDTASSHTKLGMAIHSDQPSGPLSDPLLSQLALVFEQMCVARRLRGIHSQRATADKALFDVALDGSVLAMTARAEALAASGEVCAVVGGKLLFRSDDRLAVAAASIGRGRFPGWFKWQIESGGKSWTVKVRVAGAVSTSPPRMIVNVEDRLASRNAYALRWSDCFELTPAETKLAYALAKEVSNLPQAAALLGISYNTARTHLAHLLAKTHCASQTELVATLFDL